jgi:histone H3/H4
MAYMKKTEVREFAKKKDLRVSEEFYNAMDKFVDEVLMRAARRASGNGRKTLKAVDL